jgi:hypothetical protein
MRNSVRQLMVCIVSIGWCAARAAPLQAAPGHDRAPAATDCDTKTISPGQWFSDRLDPNCQTGENKSAVKYHFNIGRTDRVNVIVTSAARLLVIQFRDGAANSDKFATTAGGSPLSFVNLESDPLEAGGYTVDIRAEGPSSAEFTIKVLAGAPWMLGSCDVGLARPAMLNEERSGPTAICMNREQQPTFVEYFSLSAPGQVQVTADPGRLVVVRGPNGLTASKRCGALRMNLEPRRHVVYISSDDPSRVRYSIRLFPVSAATPPVICT